MRLYTAQFNAVAATAAQDLFEIAAPADAVVKIHDWTVFQTSDVGDAAEEILRLETVRGVGAVTSGSGGSAVTGQPVEDGDVAFGGAVEANNTTRMAAGSGSLETMEQYGWNVRMPMEKIYTPETRPVVSPSNRWTLSLPAAPGDALTLSGMVTYEEIGG
ncbi:MAG: hypothetical protein ACREVR_02640 [Burkholderiales bacterium]